MLDDEETAKSFRHSLWAHDLGIPQNTVAGWAVPGLYYEMDTVAKANEGLKKAPDDMMGEGVIRFDPKSIKGQKQAFIHDVLTEI